MKILIYATAAEMGGAITILNHFYDLYNNTKDEIVFITSNKLLQNSTNIQILSYPKIKKSWLYRIYFYWFVLPKVVRSTNPNKIISLNNTIIPFTSVEQTLYLHQPLPFSSYKPKITKDLYLWIVKNIIGTIIVYSVKKSNFIITQSIWLKDILMHRYKIDESKIIVKPPTFMLNNDYTFQSYYTEDKINLFYPAGYISYKNHWMIVDALQRLTCEFKKKLNISFTLEKTLNKEVSKMHRRILNEQLPVDFVGYLDINQMRDYYQNNILLFPSEVESFGLPLLEARIANSPIICLDTIFSREILRDYNKVVFFKNYSQLREIFEKLCLNSIFFEVNDA